MCTTSRDIVALIVLGESDFIQQIHLVHFGSSIDEGKIEEVTVVSPGDGRSDFSPVFKEAHQQSLFVCLVEDDERAFIFWSRGVFKVFNVFGYNLPVRDQVALEKSMSPGL